MFRYITTIVLLIAFACQSMQSTFIVLDYYTNKVSFAKKCENRLRPQMNCNGKCLLMKKLQEQENKDQQNPERKMENKYEVISSSSFASLDDFFAVSTSKRYLSFPESDLIKMPRSIFHPPAA